LGPLGKIVKLDEVFPGVYSASLKIPGERPCRAAYFMYQDCPNIPDSAKRYGRLVPGYRGLLMFMDERTSVPSYVVDYEILRCKLLHGMPVSEGENLRTIANTGAELYPDYFGPLPPPYKTPWGYTTRCKALTTGVFYLETDQFWRGMAINYTVSKCLSAGIIEKLAQRDEDGQGEPSYLFVREKDACVVFFEMLGQIEEAGFYIPIAALKNAICESHPEYARRYNQEMRDAGGPPEVRFIVPDPSAGTDFFDF